MQAKKLMGLVMIVAMMGMLSLPGKALAQARPSSIAVVDVEKVMNALDEMVQRGADMKTQVEQLKQEHADRVNKLKLMKEDLQLLQQGTDAYMQKAEEIQLTGMQLEGWLKIKDSRMNSENILQINSMYRKMIDTIGKIATESGYDMVLFKEKELNIPTNIKPEVISGIISQRKVLWTRNDMDISDQVTQRMNNEWKNRQ